MITPPKIESWDDYFAEVGSILEDTKALMEDSAKDPTLSAAEKEEIRQQCIDVILRLKETILKI